MIWVLVLLCQCTQPTQSLYASFKSCDDAGQQELYKLDTDMPVYRCVEVPR